jgi:hypothetical protein
MQSSQKTFGQKNLFFGRKTYSLLKKKAMNDREQISNLFISALCILIL